MRIREDMVRPVKRLRVYLDDRTAQQLEAVAPARGRQRSAFIRQAIARALLELAEHRTRTAYTRVPNDEAGFDAAEWAVADETRRWSRRSRRSSSRSAAARRGRAPRSSARSAMRSAGSS
jgi:predicted transcriptional regulator